ncbi:MAG: VPA1262 family N-terminal domain-containing protein [Allorhizobium sp.]
MSKIIRSNWLWIAYSEGKALVYGCLVHAAEPWATIPEPDQYAIADFDGTKVEILQTLLDDSYVQQFADAIRTRSTLDLSKQGGPEIPLSGSRQRLIDGYGRRRRPTETYVGAEESKLSDDGWRKALGFLKDAIGIDFRRTPDRLGAFDIFNIPQDDRHNPLVEFNVQREESPDELSYPALFSLSADENMKEDCAVHVELQLEEDPVFSRMIMTRPGASTQVPAVPFDHYRMSVFNRSGMLVQFEEHSLLLRFGLNMSSMGTTLVINDSLAQSAQGLGAQVRESASKVQTRSTSRSLIGVKNGAAFDVHRTKMRALTRRLAPATGCDRWFHRGVAHEVGVIAHLNSLLDGGRVSAGTIVDPYFGIDTLKRVISRLESLDVDLTVITSLHSTDPETNQPNPNLLEELQTVLRDLRSSGIPNAVGRLRILNLVDGPRQAFHDRYLLLTPHEGEREVYLLSNSLNRMAGNWPFCMSKLDGAAAHEAALYIDGLANGRDISGSTQPMTTFRWPSDDWR